MERKRDQRRRGSRSPWVASIVVLLGVSAVAVSSAWATAPPKPKSGCWGTCGGVQGPVGGYFELRNGHVVNFADADSCLGRQPNGLDNQITLTVFTTSPPIQKKLAIKHDAFRFAGEAFMPVPAAEGVNYAMIPIELKGKFVSARKAQVSLTFIHDGSCGTKHLTIKQRG